jgi:hypothetical protein
MPPVYPADRFDEKIRHQGTKDTKKKRIGALRAPARFFLVYLGVLCASAVNSNLNARFRARRNIGTSL